MGTSHLAAAVVTAFTLAIIAAQSDAQNVPSDPFLLDPTNSTKNVSIICESRMENTIQCPDPAIIFYLYSGSSGDKEKMDLNDPNWLKNSMYNAVLPTVFLVHSYSGGDSLGPILVVKNAYIKVGTYNIIVMDWGALTKVNCPLQTVASLKAVSKCASHMLTYLDTAMVDVEKITCVGHGLGAHVCGVIANYGTKKMDKIIALDPSRALTFGLPTSGRLDAKDAKVVQAIHTDTDWYALSDQVGTADFCINNGAQPYCEKTRNKQLCSHRHSVCYFAESLHPARVRTGTPCGSRCPQNIAGIPVPTLSPNTQPPGDATMGATMADSASGMYCLDNKMDPPYCFDANKDPNYGDPECCPVYVN